jgi:hypothetical protein
MRQHRPDEFLELIDAMERALPPAAAGGGVAGIDYTLVASNVRSDACSSASFRARQEYAGDGAASSDSSAWEDTMRQIVQTSTPAGLRELRRHTALSYHPDRFPSALHEAAARRMADVNSLIDFKLRQLERP